MIAALDERDDDVAARESVCRFQRMLPRDVGIVDSMNQSDRTGEGDWLAQDQMIATFDDESVGDWGRFGIVGLQFEIDAVGHKRCSDGFVEGVPHQVLGEIRCGGDSDHARNPFRPRASQEKHDPTAHT